MGVVIKCDVRLPKKPQSEDLSGHLNSYQPDAIKPYFTFMVCQSWNENNNRSTWWISQACKGPNRLAAMAHLTTQILHFTSFIFYKFLSFSLSFVMVTFRTYKCQIVGYHREITKTMGNSQEIRGDYRKSREIMKVFESARNHGK